MKDKKPNVCIVGASGVGHSHLAQHIGQSVPVVVIDNLSSAENLASEVLIERFNMETSECILHKVERCQPCVKISAVRLEQKMLIHSITPADMMKHIK